MNFSCGNFLLADNVETYQPTPLFDEIKRDAGYDECPNGADGRPDCSNIQAHSLDLDGDPIVEAMDAWRARKARSLGSQSTGAPADIPVLMLSGGGGWGAFGAGYLNALGKRDWAVVTGVSTGALQGLYIAAGDYDRLQAAYDINKESDLARPNGLFGVLLRGSEYDIGPLREKVLDYLAPATGESPLLRIARPGSPALSVAMVEARSGDLRVVHVSRMVRAAFGSNPRPTPVEVRRVAACVAGVVIGSSSIPARLTPVRIDGHTYVDGGVRSSVFDVAIGRRMTQYAARAAAAPAPAPRPDAARPHLYVIRNGPTIVFRDADDKDHPGVAQVDARPDILRVGLRGYSTIVNQNEVTSIAALRLTYPRGGISVISADGFNAPNNPGPCGPRPAALFSAPFMHCLIGWGRYKATNGPHFIDLRELEAEDPLAELRGGKR